MYQTLKTMKNTGAKLIPQSPVRHSQPDYEIIHEFKMPIYGITEGVLVSIVSIDVFCVKEWGTLRPLHTDIIHYSHPLVL